jgi:hypothetical protein
MSDPSLKKIRPKLRVKKSPMSAVSAYPVEYLVMLFVCQGERIISSTTVSSRNTSFRISGKELSNV